MNEKIEFSVRNGNEGGNDHETRVDTKWSSASTGNYYKNSMKIILGNVQNKIDDGSHIIS